VGLFGDAGSIITAGLAVYAVSVYEVRSFRRRRRLEDYLRQEKAKGVDKGQRSLLHLAAQLGISEQELVNISFSSKKIARRVRENPATGLAETLLLEYVADT
jgi:hypothetical protein